MTTTQTNQPDLTIKSSTVTSNGTTASEIYAPGLEGIIAAETRLSSIDGQKGMLTIAGYPLEEVAGKATFEEMLYLLWHDRLPITSELDGFKSSLAEWRSLPVATITLLKSMAQANLPVMDALRVAAGTVDIDMDPDLAMEQRAVVIMARLPTIVATYWRLLNGKGPIAPNPDVGLAHNYLTMLLEDDPTQSQAGQGQVTQSQVRGMETYLNTVIEHGLNASTFTARVIIATQTDLTSAVVGAIGALKGPLHGGAPGPALDTVFEIGRAERAEPVLREKLANGERLMGFGHRIYKVRDPRAQVLAMEARRLFQEGGDMELYELAQHVEEVAVALLKEAKPTLSLQANVEFYTALLLHGIGLETALFTPTFAVSRAGGWIAHCIEHLKEGRLMRPKGRYIGAQGQAWIGLAERRG